MPVYRVYRAVSPYIDADLVNMDYEQTADVVYIAHQSYPPGKLVRYDNTNFQFAAVAFTPTIDPPTNCVVVATINNQDAANSGNAFFSQPASYFVTAINETTGQESRPSNKSTVSNDLSLKRNYNTITWAAVTGASGYRVYKGDNTSSLGYVGNTTDLRFVDDNIGADLSSGAPVGDNPFDTVNNYPSTITFHEQRSWWGRTYNQPNALWASRSADYENMDYTRPGREDDAIVIGLVANKVNSINNLVSTKQGLMALTSHNLFTIQGSNEDYITAVPPPRVRPEISRGASRLKPIKIDSITFYETSKSGEVRAVGYEYNVDGVKSNDVTIFSRHLFDGFKIVSWVWVEKPASAILAVRSDGTLLCFTWDEPQQVWGWTHYDTDGLFLDCCTITEQGEDRVYFKVQRTIGGVTKYYIERMASELWVNQEDACYLDCARTFVNTAITTRYDRLDHLEGKTVVAWVDGDKVDTNPAGGPLVVTGGAVTLATGGLKVSIGLPFTAEVETLPLAMQTGTGWSVARPQAAAKVILRVVNSRNIMAGSTADQMFEVKQRELEVFGAPITLLTGDLEVAMAGKSGNETTVMIRSSDPTPFHLAAVLIEPELGGASATS